MSERKLRGALVTVFGGSGFIGRYVVERLAEAGARVRVAVRRPEEALFLKPLGDLGQIDIQQANLRFEDSVARVVHGADYVVNCVGILAPSGAQNFAAVHARGAETIARACAAKGVQALVHISALGADANSPALYAQTKAEGEARVRAAFPPATILRPSIVFGVEDEFFNRFAAMARFFRALPLVGFGVTRFQPVYVDDVARAVIACLENADTAAKTYELGGPRVYSFRELLDIMLQVIRRGAIYLPLPFPIARAVGRVAQLFPGAPITFDQVLLLQQDNVVAPDALTFQQLGIAPSPLEGRIETYLRRFRPPSRMD